MNCIQTKVQEVYIVCTGIVQIKATWELGIVLPNALMMHSRDELVKTKEPSSQLQ